MERKVSGLRAARTLYCSVAICLLILTVFCSSPARGDWSGDVHTDPHSAYQSTTFDFKVTVTNTGDKVMHVTYIGAVIEWPLNLPDPDMPKPSESFDVFSGNQSIAPGESHTFSHSVSSGFFGGGFPMTVTITALSEGDAAPVTRGFQSSISFAPASEAPPSPAGAVLPLDAPPRRTWPHS